MSRCNNCLIEEENLPIFGGPGDPLVGDFTGRKLVKTYRSLYEGPDIEEYEVILKKINKEGTNIPDLILEFGDELCDKAFNYDQAKNTIGSSWECRHCILN